MKLFSVILILICGLSLISCKKDVIQGCTDSDATNYSADANQENGTCNYSGTLSFWYDSQTKDSITANDIYSIVPRTSETEFTNIPANVFIWSFEPDCATNVSRLPVDLGSSKAKWVKFDAAALNSNNVQVKIWEDSFYVDAQSCHLYKIIW